MHPGQELERVKVKHPSKPGAFVFVNRLDFDPAKHEEYVEPAAEPESPAAKEPAEPAAKAKKK